MQYGEVEGALSYLQTHGQTMQGLEELKLKIGVYVGNSLVTPAYHLLVRDWPARLVPHTLVYQPTLFWWRAGLLD